ncbi:MAG TPA: class I SAM-dependent methyltransferase [Solirubrobacteraceae bacterium]|nr:class I SAM-dependent methyltransferase [Solirubrobacteraceae bacterium]
MTRIYEWGCGTGKTVRRFAELDPGLEVYGSDYDERVISWCRANIPQVTFTLNGLEPPLAFDNEFFDLLYSFSVYTHLPPDLQRRWLEEQLRVVRPGGLILLSVHGDAYKDRLTPAEREAYDSHGMVVHGGTGAGGPWFTTFNSPRWMERELLAGHEIIHRSLHAEGAAKAQDVWVMRKPITPPPSQPPTS